MANLRVQQKQQTRRRLLDSALELFTRNGYVATTIDEIATATSTTRVTFYAHFPNKRELMRALYDDLNVLLDRSASDAHGSTAVPLVEAVRIGTADSIRPWLSEQIAKWPLIKSHIGVAAVAAAVDPEIRELAEGWFDEVIGDMVDGMALAERFDPAERHFRGFLALEVLDRANLRWIRHPWALESGPQLDVLTDAWVHLLGTE